MTTCFKWFHFCWQRTFRNCTNLSYVVTPSIKLLICDYFLAQYFSIIYHWFTIRIRCQTNCTRECVKCDIQWNKNCFLFLLLRYFTFEHMCSFIDIPVGYSFTYLPTFVCMCADCWLLTLYSLFICLILIYIDYAIPFRSSLTLHCLP